MKNYAPILGLALLLSITGCNEINKMINNSDSEIPTDMNVIKSYHENGKLKSYYQVNELKQKNGEAKIYNKEGKMEKSFIYENDEKIQAISYHQNGNPLMEINYQNGVKDGAFKRYYESGQLESEAIFKEDYAGKGLKEYTKSGELKVKYPELIIKAIDNLEKNGTYIIEVYFDKDPGRGTYYLGKLTEGQFLNYSLDKLERTNYRGRLTLQPPPGVMVMEKMNFVGEYKTPTGNKYIVEKEFNVAFEHGF